MRCYLRLSSTTPSSSPSLAKICYVRKYTDILHPYTSLPPFLPLPSFDRDFRPSRARQQRRRRRRRPFLSNALRHRLPAPLLFLKSYYASRWRVSTNPFMRFLLISGTGTVPSFSSIPWPRSIDRFDPLSSQPPSVFAHQAVSIISPSFSRKNLKRDVLLVPRDYYNVIITPLRISSLLSLPSSTFFLLLLPPYRTNIRGDGVSHRGVALTFIISLSDLSYIFENEARYSSNEFFSPILSLYNRNGSRGNRGRLSFVGLCSRVSFSLGGEGGVDLTGLRSRVLLEGKSVLRHFELRPSPPSVPIHSYTGTWYGGWL